MSKKILVVEDDTDFQDLYKLYLQGSSYEVRVAGNGQEGLEVLADWSPDLIVLDLIMPVMDGETFYVSLRAKEEWKNIPVVIASVNELLPAKILELGGVSENLKKPFTMQAFLETIREHIG